MNPEIQTQNQNEADAMVFDDEPGFIDTPIIEPVDQDQPDPFRHDSLKSVQTSANTQEWEKAYEASGNDFLKAGEQREWVYRDENGTESSVTATITDPEVASVHNEILNQLYEQGYAIYESEKPDGTLMKEIYFANRTGRIFQETYIKSPEPTEPGSDGTLSLFEVEVNNEDDDDLDQTATDFYDQLTQPEPTQKNLQVETTALAGTEEPQKTTFWETLSKIQAFTTTPQAQENLFKVVEQSFSNIPEISETISTTPVRVESKTLEHPVQPQNEQKLRIIEAIHNDIQKEISIFIPTITPEEKIPNDPEKSIALKKEKDKIEPERITEPVKVEKIILPALLKTEVSKAPKEPKTKIVKPMQDLKQTIVEKTAEPFTIETSEQELVIIDDFPESNEILSIEKLFFPEITEEKIISSPKYTQTKDTKETPVKAEIGVEESTSIQIPAQIIDTKSSTPSRAEQIIEQKREPVEALPESIRATTSVKQIEITSPVEKSIARPHKAQKIERIDGNIEEKDTAADQTQKQVTTKQERVLPKIIEVVDTITQEPKEVTNVTKVVTEKIVRITPKPIEPGLTSVPLQLKQEPRIFKKPTEDRPEIKQPSLIIEKSQESIIQPILVAPEAAKNTIFEQERTASTPILEPEQAKNIEPIHKPTVQTIEVMTKAVEKIEELQTFQEPTNSTIEPTQTHEPEVEILEKTETIRPESAILSEAKIITVQEITHKPTAVVEVQKPVEVSKPHLQNIEKHVEKVFTLSTNTGIYIEQSVHQPIPATQEKRKTPPLVHKKRTHAPHPSPTQPEPITLINPWPTSQKLNTLTLH